MKWLLDLLIEKWNTEESDEFEPAPLYIKDLPPDPHDRSDNHENDDEEDKKVIIIDLN